MLLGPLGCPIALPALVASRAFESQKEGAHTGRQRNLCFFASLQLQGKVLCLAFSPRVHKLSGATLEQESAPKRRFKSK